MLIRTVVLGLLFFAGVQSQLWEKKHEPIGLKFSKHDTCFRPFENREEPNPFNFWPFFPHFNLYAQPWWKGPNVCIERSEIIENPRNQTKEEVEVVEDISHLFQASLSFSHCFETPSKYECVTKLHVHGEDKTFSTKYKCCHGFSRSRVSDQCAPQGELKPLMEVIGENNGTEFKTIIGTAGMEDRLANENYTVFVPVDDLDDESANEISEAGKVGSSSDLSASEATELVLNHISPGFIDLNDFTNEDLIDSESRNNSLRFNFYPKPRSGRMATVNCARIVKGNVFATNGIVHFIDRRLEVPTVDLSEFIETNPRLTFFRKVLKTVFRDGFFSDDEHYTLFAPTDDAFEKLDPSTQEKLLQGHACARSILRHHVSPHTVCSVAIVENATVHNIDGEVLSMERKPTDEVFIDGTAKITEADKLVTNGVVQFIDRVLIPESAFPIEGVLAKNNVTKFQNLIEKAGLKEEFDSMENVTVFSPFNEAFEEPDAVKYLDEIQNDQAKLRELVLFHVVNDKIESDDMYRSTLLETKLPGKSLRLSVHSQFFPIIYGPGLSPPLIQCASLTKFEEKSCGSVIHEIDRLLIPPSKTIYELIGDESKFSTLRSILEGTEVEEKLKDPTQNLTLLAPSNYAFGRYRYDLDTLKQNKTLANTVLKRHVVKKPMCCQEFNYADNVFNRWSTFRNPFETTSRMITECDRAATNGVVHTVNLFMYHHK